MGGLAPCPMNCTSLYDGLQSQSVKAVYSSLRTGDSPWFYNCSALCSDRNRTRWIYHSIMNECDCCRYCVIHIFILVSQIIKWMYLVCIFLNQMVMSFSLLTRMIIGSFIEYLRSGLYMLYYSCRKMLLVHWEQYDIPVVFRIQVCACLLMKTVY